MSERITLKDCNAVCENLNRRLENAGSVARVRLGGRNGYLAADEARENGSIVRTLTVGTKREVYEALWNMIRGIDLLSVS